VSLPGLSHPARHFKPGQISVPDSSFLRVWFGFSNSLKLPTCSKKAILKNTSTRTLTPSPPQSLRSVSRDPLPPSGIRGMCKIPRSAGSLPPNGNRRQAWRPLGSAKLGYFRCGEPRSARLSDEDTTHEVKDPNTKLTVRSFHTPDRSNYQKRKNEEVVQRLSLRNLPDSAHGQRGP